ncbi:MAG: hypothetical protein HOV68_08075 [Streptomycetaceae bacterium]|nr:hypothetical protein [Streptomycetaceae bacterium]
MQPNDPAPPLSDGFPDELSEQARFTLEDILVSRPGAVSTRTGVGPTPRRIFGRRRRRRDTPNFDFSRRRRRRRWVIPLTIAVATSTGVAVALVFPEPEHPKSVDRVDCYTDTDMQADPYHGGSTAWDGAPDNSGIAIELCANMWRVGLLRPKAPGVVAPTDGSAPSGDWPVPHLVACVRDDVPAVFPSDDPAFCRTAGLPPLLPGPRG